MRTEAWLVGVLVIGSVVAGCGSDGGPPDGGQADGAGQPDAGDGPDAAAPRIDWRSCRPGFVSECALVSVPLDWAAPSGGSIDVYMSRFPARAAAARGQLWLLQGGPGGSGEAFVGFIPELALRVPDLDIYVLEHRGVGASSRLGCPTAENPTSVLGSQIDPTEWRDCVGALQSTWGTDLAFFNITQAANDLAHLAEATRKPGQQLFIYGGSYGTSWAMRFLQLRPDDATGVVLDSVVAPGRLFLSKFDQGFDPVAMELSRACAADAACASKLGPDPWARIGDVFRGLDQGHCPALALDRRTWSSLMAAFLQILDLRTLVFPLMYRLERCADGDVTAIAHLFAMFTDTGGVDDGPRADSQALEYNIALSELWETPPPDAAEVARRHGDALFWPGVVDAAAPVFEFWPRYTLDAFAHKWPTSTVPILAMNGTLDPQTPIEQARSVRTALTAPHQSLVEFPGAPHITIINTPPGSVDPTLPCGQEIMLGFLSNPTAPLVTTCLAPNPVTFTWPPLFARVLLGTEDIWENPVAYEAAGEDRRAAAAPPDWPAVTRSVRRLPLYPSGEQPPLAGIDLLR